MKTTPLNPKTARPNRSGKPDNCCCVCKKPIRKESKHRWVHIIEGGLTVLHPDSESEYKSDGGDMYFHPIGSDCARKLGIEFTHENAFHS